MLLNALPALILERIATPRWLRAVANRLDNASAERGTPDWIRDEVDGTASFADACRTLAHVLRALGARTPRWERLRTTAAEP